MATAAPAYLSVADVRQALLALRGMWYEKMTPDEPFLFSALVLEAPLEPPSGVSEWNAVAETQKPPSPRPPGPPRQLPHSQGEAKAAETRAIAVSEFGCIFDYGQHIKRHTRSGR